MSKVEQIKMKFRKEIRKIFKKVGDLVVKTADEIGDLTGELSDTDRLDLITIVMEEELEAKNNY